MLRDRGARIAAALGIAMLAAVEANAESALVLPYPAVFGHVPASTYDARGQRVGEANLLIEKLDNGSVRLFMASGIEGGARTVAFAEFEIIDSGRSLRLVRQESRSFDPEGTPLGVLLLDHQKGTGRCSVPNGSGSDAPSIAEMALPLEDRVANISLSLLFVPLVRGEVERTSFELFLCRGQPRVVPFEARVTRREEGRNGSRSVVEVQYWPDFGAVVSLIAQNWLPALTFWFDPKAPEPWLAHRIPLYSKGPEVLVVREGISPSQLGLPE